MLFPFLEKKKRPEKIQISELKAYISGTVIPIERVSDDVFSSKMLGKGIAIEPVSNVVKAPCDGEISVVMEDSKHAVGMRLNNGAEILIHEGLDTIDMNGEGFEIYVKEGQMVKTGDKLFSFDPECIRKHNHPLTCILVLTNSDEFPNVKFETGIEAAESETVIMRF